MSKSDDVHDILRGAILNGTFRPLEALKPQELADRLDVSLAVVREALLRLVGDGLAERVTNRGFVVPAADDRRWQEIAEARALTEPAVLRLAVDRGDLAWESGVRAAHHRLARTPLHAEDGSTMSDAWTDAHHDFHRALLEGAANTVLLAGFERLWTASELMRRWSAYAPPSRDVAREHRELERLALARDADRAAAALEAHIYRTASSLSEQA